MNLDASKISLKFFDTRQALLDQINDPQFSLTIDSFCFAVVFNESAGTGKYNYELMFNTSSISSGDYVNPALPVIDLLTK